MCVVDTSKYQQSPLLVQVERCAGSFLGISLSCDAETNRGVFIESISSGSTAERCGALHVGDQILAVGDVRLDSGAENATQEAMRLLRNYSTDSVKLIIVPCSNAQRRQIEAGRSKLPPPSPRPSHCGTLNGLRNRMNSGGGGGGRTRNARILQRVDSCTSSSRVETASVASASTQSSWGQTSAVMLSHPESVQVTLQIDCRASYGLTLGQVQGVEVPVVVSMEANSPSERFGFLCLIFQVRFLIVVTLSRSGCIQPGDRVIRINQQSTSSLNLEQVMTVMRESKPRITLDVEFDVADSVIPASGTFWVKLVKRRSSYGITLTGTC